MTIGTLIHELVQKALTQNIQDIQQLNKEADRIIKESIQLLYDAGISEDVVKTDMQAYIPPLAEFMQTYLAKKPPSSVTVSIYYLKRFNIKTLPTFSVYSIYSRYENLLSGSKDQNILFYICSKTKKANGMDM